MPYSPPIITSAGLSVPAYSDILQDLMDAYLAIYPPNSYLGTDSSDYQWISAVALKMSDILGAVQLAYNSRSPLTAVGADLDAVIVMNGMERLVPSSSTVTVTLTGKAGTVINNGVVSDANNNYWDLPSTVTIGSGGAISVIATSEGVGPITAGIGAVTGIVTPTAGWISVTNPTASIDGQAAEQDSQLRARQLISVALPSETTLAGTIAGIAQTSGVTRYNVLENPTGAVDSYGNPPHSITAVVEGASDLAVATAIYNNRGIGCLTNGTTAVAVADPNTSYVTTINFDRPTYVPIYVTIPIHGFNGAPTSTLQAAVQTAIVDYLNSLQIGEEVSWSALNAVAMGQAGSISLPSFSVRGLTSGIASNPTGTSDIALNFNQVAQGITANVLVTII